MHLAAGSNSDAMLLTLSLRLLLQPTHTVMTVKAILNAYDLCSS